jgi:two-component system sensor histidine kinase KdpD
MMMMKAENQMQKLSLPLYLAKPLPGIAVTLAVTALLITILTPYREDVSLLNIGLVFLLAVLLISAAWGYLVGLFAAVVANLALNFFFIEPVHKFAVQEPQNVIALIVFLIVSALASTFLAAARHATGEAKRRQAEAEVALRLSRAMAGETEPHSALESLCREVTAALAAPGTAVLTHTDDGWSVLSHAGHAAASRAPSPEERAAAGRAAASGSLDGLGHMGLGSSRARRIVVPRGRRAPYERQQSVALMPLKLGDRVLGVLRLDGPLGDSPFRGNPRPLLTAITGEAAVAVQRIELAQQAAHAEALRAADELKSALMASISHDLNTPLAGIKAAISSIRDTRVAWSETDLDAFYQTIDSQADRLSRVISNLLDLKRIESGTLKPEQTPLSAIELLKQAREITAAETEGREVTVEGPASLWVGTDEALITQALVNLVENAAKYSVKGGAIHLKAELDGPFASLTVEDEGPGIPLQERSQIFQPFYRAENQTARTKGSGLGLSIVKGFVELCGGTVDIASSRTGTRFVIRLPAVSIGSRT